MPISNGNNRLSPPSSLALKSSGYFRSSSVLSSCSCTGWSSRYKGSRNFYTVPQSTRQQATCMATTFIRMSCLSASPTEHCAPACLLVKCHMEDSSILRPTRTLQTRTFYSIVAGNPTKEGLPHGFRKHVYVTWQ